MGLNRTFQVGMPVDLKELREQANGIDFDKLVEHTVNNTNACILTNNMGRIVHTFPSLGDTVPFMDINLIKAKGWSVIIQKQDKHEFTAISDSYWNCQCKKNNIHHRIVGKCAVCNKNATVKQMVSIEKFIKRSFKWEFIVGE